MESLSPNIFVRDMAATISLYEILGFHVVVTVPENSVAPDWAMMMNGKVTFMFQTFGNLGDAYPEIHRSDGASMLLYIKMMGIRKFFDQISEKIKPVSDLQTTFYGATEFSIIDNNGYMLTFAEDE